MNPIEIIVESLTGTGKLALLFVLLMLAWVILNRSIRKP